MIELIDFVCKAILKQFGSEIKEVKSNGKKTKQ